MQRAIVGFEQDEVGDWRAILACGHRLHVRHNPPLSERQWVLTEEGRRRFLGVVVDCKACDEGEPVGDAAIAPEALAALYGQFQAELWRWLAPRVAGPDAAEATLRTVYGLIHAGDVAEGEPLAGWLYRIVRQATAEHERRARPPAEATPGGLPEGEEQAGAAAFVPAARAMLACLPGKPRQALLLAGDGGLTPAAIAARLDVPLGEAEARLRRGRALLREALWDCCHVAAERDGWALPYRADCPTCAA